MAAERGTAATATWEPHGESKEFSLGLPTGVRESAAEYFPCSGGFQQER